MSEGMDRKLVRELADSYPDSDSIRRLLQTAEVPMLGRISWTSRPIDTWHSALHHARTQGRILDLLTVILDENPDNAVFNSACYEERMQQAAHPPKALGWQREVPSDQLEKIMGRQSTLLPISFLQVGLQRAQSVARITCRDGSNATGFLTSDDLFVTTHHAFSSRSDAEGLAVEFGYDEAGMPPASVRLEPSRGFATEPAHDCTIVRAEAGSSVRWGAIPVTRRSVDKVNWVNIIQHPGGGPKRIALYHNIVSYADADVVQYYTDTLPGSSGSPVFDSAWNLVAVHRAGGDLYEPGGNRVVYRNEGLNVNRVADLLMEIG